MTLKTWSDLKYFTKSYDHFRVFGYPWIPLITILLYLAIFVILVTTQTRTAMYGSLVVGGLIIAGLSNKRRHKI